MSTILKQSKKIKKESKFDYERVSFDDDVVKRRFFIIVLKDKHKKTAKQRLEDFVHRLKDWHNDDTDKSPQIKDYVIFKNHKAHEKRYEVTLHTFKQYSLDKMLQYVDEIDFHGDFTKVRGLDIYVGKLRERYSGDKIFRPTRNEITQDNRPQCSCSKELKALCKNFGLSMSLQEAKKKINTKPEKMEIEENSNTEGDDCDDNESDKEEEDDEATESDQGFINDEEEEEEAQKTQSEDNNDDYDYVPPRSPPKNRRKKVLIKRQKRTEVSRPPEAVQPQQQSNFEQMMSMMMNFFQKQDQNQQEQQKYHETMMNFFQKQEQRHQEVKDLVQSNQDQQQKQIQQEQRKLKEEIDKTLFNHRFEMMDIKAGKPPL